jgi:hypothetical protein
LCKGLAPEGQDFDRNLAREPGIPRPVNLSHPSRAKRGEDLVGAETRTGRIFPGKSLTCPTCPTERRGGKPEAAPAREQ